VWSLAKLSADINQDITQLLEAITGEAVSQLRDVRARTKFIPQNLSNMCHPFRPRTHSLCCLTPSPRACSPCRICVFAVA